MVNGRREFVYGNNQVVRFCLGPFQDACIERVRRQRRLKFVALQMGVTVEELRNWWRWSRRSEAA